MEAITKRLPLLAFVLAAFAAVAFTSPENDDPQYGLHNGVWYNVTDQDPGENTYVCNSQENSECLFDAPDGLGDPINPGEDRIFVKMPPAIAE